MRQLDTKALKRILTYVKKYRLFVFFSVFCAALTSVIQLLIPIFCGDAIDYMLGEGQVSFEGVLRYVIYIVVAALIGAAAQQILAVCNNRVTYCVSRDLRNEADRKIHRLPLSYLDVHPTGDLVSRMINDVDTFADGLLMGFTQLFTGMITIIGTLVIMLSLNPAIALIVVVLTPLSLFVAAFIAKSTHRYFKEQASIRGEQTALINELMEGQRVIQAYGHEDESLADFDAINDSLQKAAFHATFFSSLYV